MPGKSADMSAHPGSKSNDVTAVTDANEVDITNQSINKSGPVTEAQVQGLI